jgi:plastocyanin
MTSTPLHVGPLARYAGAALAGLLLLLSAGIAFAAPAEAAAYNVVIKQYAYSPASLTIDQGDTVTWTNQDSVQHDVMVTAGAAMVHSPMLSQGQSWSHTFTTAGSYSYICSVHPDMKASVTVRPAPTHTAAAVPTKAPKRPTAKTPGASATPTATTPAGKPTARHTAAHATAAPPQVAAPAAGEQLNVPLAQASSATLDPLLIVAGVSTAVMVFCLLLMTSRPAVQPVEEPPTD